MVWNITCVHSENAGKVMANGKKENQNEIIVYSLRAYFRTWVETAAVRRYRGGHDATRGCVVIQDLKKGTRT